jgi:hypothetical protein
MCMKNRNGQALLLIVVAMTIALALGINIASRTISSVSRTSRTDTFQRVKSAAEGGIEHFLSKGDTELSALAASGEVKTIDFSTTTGDNISTSADVLVEEYKCTTEDYYEFDLKKNETIQIKLSDIGTTLPISWTSRVGSDLYGQVYSNTTLLTKFYLRGGGSASNITVSSDAAVKNISKDATGYYTHNLPLGTLVNETNLRLRAVGDDTHVRIPCVTLPNQGYVISSEGKLTNGGEVVATSAAKVYKTYTYPSGLFDFALISEGASINGGEYDSYRINISKPAGVTVTSNPALLSCTSTSCTGDFSSKYNVTLSVPSSYKFSTPPCANTSSCFIPSNSVSGTIDLFVTNLTAM